MTTLAPMTEKKFAVIYADPPWDIAQAGARGAVQHYELMTLDRIKEMPVASLAADDSTLLLWATNAALPAALEVMAAWGFTYKTNAVWDKYHMGLGNYFRGSHEILLHGVRGRAPFKFRGQRSTLLFQGEAVMTAPRHTLDHKMGSSGRYSVRYSSHDEHPPPHSPLFWPRPPLSGGDSPCIAGDNRGAPGRRKP
ncbi:methyltransferase [Rathayibacter sp. AY1C6]|uniref:MT-A70 family methyltransferase n=1 Tax=Rathayibacter sp. AY1C6 TaxID=2080539 RepID=UPI000CE8B12E|nr:MT-A70 family methyltransferase [Rathayibacter sp. AY1C6]PPG15132.1 methyltransferase [Rathayibacter sp. AY1C6]